MAIWLYTHLPLVIGIVATGVGVEKVLEQQIGLPDAVRWLVCGAVALCCLMLGILHRLGVIRYSNMQS